MTEPIPCDICHPNIRYFKGFKGSKLPSTPNTKCCFQHFAKSTELQDVKTTTTRLFHLLKIILHGVFALNNINLLKFIASVEKRNALAQWNQNLSNC